MTSDNFAVLIDFEQLCECKPEMDLRERCELCCKMISYEEKEKWKLIVSIVEQKELCDPDLMLFGGSEWDDVESILQSLDETLEDDLIG